jgi:hypothetical protein
MLVVFVIACLVHAVAHAWAGYQSSQHELCSWSQLMQAMLCRNHGMQSLSRTRRITIPYITTSCRYRPRMRRNAPVVARLLQLDVTNRAPS